MLFRSYIEKGFVGIEKIMTRFTRNDYEPDVVYFSEEKANEFTDEQKLFPVPDLIVEVLSKSTENRDRGVKFQDYESHGVSEYWIVSPEKQTIEQYLLKDKQYELNIKASNGVIKCKAINGLMFEIEACFDEQLHKEALRIIMQKS